MIIYSAMALNMRSFLFVALGTSILMSGCSKNDDISPKVLEQQKLNEDILKRNQDTLDKINQKAKEIAKKEKEARDALNKIEVKKKELTARENKLNEYAKDLSKREENVKKLLEDEMKLADDIKKQNAIAETRSELDKKRTLFLDELAVDWAKAAQRNPHLPEALETELDKELDDAIAKNQSNSSIRAIYNKYYEMAGTLWYNNIKTYLQQNDLIHINSDEEFEKTAKESVEKFMRLNTSRDDFLEIEKRYIELLSAKKQDK
ncbi:MAG: hypothetical protein ABSA16_00375 [Thermoguttaceae bacterium]|jgi:hypothetical protein